MAIACISTHHFIKSLNLSAQLYKSQSNFTSTLWQ